jgi:AmiR/NasT family two-component response regulator
MTAAKRIVMAHRGYSTEQATRLLEWLATETDTSAEEVAELIVDGAAITRDVLLALLPDA